MKTEIHAPTDKFTARPLLTIDEVAAHLKLSPATVHRLPLASIRLGRTLRFDPVDLDRLIEDSKEQVIS